MADTTATPTGTAPAPPRILRLATVAARLDVSESTVRRREAQDPSFPRRRHLGGNVMGFLEEDINRWIHEHFEDETE